VDWEKDCLYLNFKTLLTIMIYFVSLKLMLMKPTFWTFKILSSFISTALKNIKENPEALAFM